MIEINTEVDFYINRVFNFNTGKHLNHVTYDAQGGVQKTYMVMSSADKQTIEPAPPTKDGYEFGGWYKEIECLEKWDFKKDVLTDDITLYAKWSEK